MRKTELFFVCLVFFSCGKKPHEEYYSFNEKHWNSDSIVIFKYNVHDTINKYDLILKIRHTINYEFQNLFVFLREEEKKDTVEVIFATKEGRWLGKGLSDVREIEYILEKGKIFPKKDEYKLTLEQAMRYGPKEKIENLLIIPRPVALQVREPSHLPQPGRTRR